VAVLAALLTAKSVHAADAVQTLVVTAARGALQALDAPASMRVVTAQDIVARSGPYRDRALTPELPPGYVGVRVSRVRL
jgi:outer membrane cobalamin receptor